MNACYFPFITLRFILIWFDSIYHSNVKPSFTTACDLLFVIFWRICHSLYNITVNWKTSKNAEPILSYEIKNSAAPYQDHSPMCRTFQNWFIIYQKRSALVKGTNNQLSTTIYASDIHMRIWVMVTNENPSFLKPWFYITHFLPLQLAASHNYLLSHKHTVNSHVKCNLLLSQQLISTL